MKIRFVTENIKAPQRAALSVALGDTRGTAAADYVSMELSADTIEAVRYSGIVCQLNSSGLRAFEATDWVAIGLAILAVGTVVIFINHELLLLFTLVVLACLTVLAITPIRFHSKKLPANFVERLQQTTTLDGVAFIGDCAAVCIEQKMKRWPVKSFGFAVASTLAAVISYQWFTLAASLVLFWGLFATLLMVRNEMARNREPFELLILNDRQCEHLINSMPPRRRSFEVESIKQIDSGVELKGGKIVFQMEMPAAAARTLVVRYQENR